VDFYGKLGFETPKVAALAASETVNVKISETKDAADLRDMSLRGELGACVLEGPLSFDIAVSQEVAAKKGHPSEISGDVDIFLAPDIAAGNILVKSLLYWGDAKLAGCILGAQVPIVLVSRGSSAEEKLLSLLICIS